MEKESAPADEGWTTYDYKTEDEARYRRSMAHAEKFIRAAVAPDEPDPVSGGPDTPGHTAPGR